MQATHPSADVAADAAGWWWQACFDGTTLTAGAAMVAAAGGLALLLRAWVGVHRGSGGMRHKAPGEAGTATLEFALVFPIVLLLMLVLLQTTLVMAGNFFVHYAAFAATRSAIVQIPADLSDRGGTPANQFTPSPRAPKLQAIERAAVFAVMPVAGHASEANINTNRFVTGLNNHYAAYGKQPPRWIETQAASRLRYAAAHTDVRVLRTSVEPGGTVRYQAVLLGEMAEFGPKAPITVEVTHRLNLSIPYARAIFADGRHDSGGAGEGAYADLSARYTLTNEGLDSSLPPEPRLPRRWR